MKEYGSTRKLFRNTKDGVILNNLRASEWTKVEPYLDEILKYFKLSKPSRRTYTGEQVCFFDLAHQQGVSGHRTAAPWTFFAFHTFLCELCGLSVDRSAVSENLRLPCKAPHHI